MYPLKPIVSRSIRPHGPLYVHLLRMMLRLQLTPAATHKDAMNSLRLLGKYVIPHFLEKEKIPSCRSTVQRRQIADPWEWCSSRTALTTSAGLAAQVIRHHLVEEGYDVFPVRVVPAVNPERDLVRSPPVWLSIPSKTHRLFPASLKPGFWTSLETREGWNKEQPKVNCTPPAIASPSGPVKNYLNARSGKSRGGPLCVMTGATLIKAAHCLPAPRQCASERRREEGTAVLRVAWLPSLPPSRNRRGPGTAPPAKGAGRPLPSAPLW